MKRLFNKVNILIVVLLLVFALGACEPTVEECEKGYEETDRGCQLIEVVVGDTEAPVFGAIEDVEFEVGDDAPDYMAIITVTDNEDGNLLASVVVDDSAVDLTTAGIYVVNLTVSDAAGNDASATFNVVVTVPLTAADQAQADLDAIDISALTADGVISLPVFVSTGTLFYWTSSDTRIITNRGFIIPPPVGSGPVVVTLSARAENTGMFATKDYEVTVQPWGELTVTSKVTVPFEGTSEEYVVDDKTGIDVYYMNDGTVPYIDIETFIDMLDGAITSDELVYTLEGTDVLVLSYDVEYEDFDGQMVTETLEAVINFTDNTFTVETFDFFESYVDETESDYGEGLNYLDAFYVDSESVTIPLGEYNFDLVIHDDAGEDQYLMPFAVANLLFAGGIYYDAYFNGDTIYGIDTFGISGGGEEADAILYTARTSSLNDEEMADDLKWATVNYLALAFDYFYGLKEDKVTETFYEKLSVKSQSLVTGSDSELYSALFDFAYGLDDLHTSHAFQGYYQGPDAGQTLALDDLGPRSRAFYEQGLWDVQDKIEAKYGTVDAMPTYELLDNNTIAVYHITGFDIDSPDEFKGVLDALPATVTSVVIDLSYNTGGNVGAVFRMFGYMTEETFTYHSQNPADGSAATYFIDSDYEAYDYEWFIVTSKVTFSAANLMASMAQEEGIATIMGKPSSGGASSIGVLITPDGTGLVVSTNSVISRRTGNEVDGYEYLSIEYGITPDRTMINVLSDTEIINIVNDVNTVPVG